MGSLKDAILEQLQDLRDLDNAEERKEMSRIQERLEYIDKLTEILVEVGVAPLAISNNKDSDRDFPKVVFVLAGVSMVLWRVEEPFVKFYKESESNFMDRLEMLPSTEILSSAIARTVARSLRKDEINGADLSKIFQ